MIEQQVLYVIYIRLQYCCLLLIQGTLLVCLMLLLARLGAYCFLPCVKYGKKIGTVPV